MLLGNKQTNKQTNQPTNKQTGEAAAELGYTAESWDKETPNRRMISLEAPSYEAWSSYTGLVDFGDNPTELKRIKPLAADIELTLATAFGDNSSPRSTNSTQTNTIESQATFPVRGRRKKRKDSWGVK